MKKVIGLIFALFTVFLINDVVAQGAHDLIIEPPTAPGVYINNDILGDTLAGNVRKDPDRVYVLRRGGQYYVNTQIRNTGWVLRVKAEDGSGRKPVLFVIRNTTTGTTPGRIFDVRGNLSIKNIILDGYVEADITTIGNMQGALITVSASGFDVVADSCIFTNSSGNHIRTDSAPRVVKVTNSIFANMGYLGTSNFGAGKALDLRAGSCDTLLLVNNTFVNSQDRIIRHYNSSANIKYMKFDHNTIVNSMSYHGNLVLGKVGKKMEITNNLFYDAFAAGNDTDYVRQVEFSNCLEYDSRGLARMTWVNTEPNDSTQWVVNNNYYVVSTEGQAWYDKWASAGVTGEGSPLTWHQNKRVADSTKTFTKVNLTLTNIPRLMTAMMDWYRSPTGGNKTKATTTWSAPYDYDRRSWTYYTDTLSCTYPTSSSAYIGAEGYFPAGDLNWYPSMLNLWKSGGTVGVEKPNSVPLSFTLNQNYPNPFNPTTNISYSLPKAANVTIRIFNSIGQEIAVLVNNELQSAGYHKLSWNGKNSAGRVAATGVYFYQMQTNEISMTKKMLLLK